MSALRQKAIVGVFWSAIERFSSQGIQFVLGIILARLLTPHDYGLVGLLAIFIAISQTFVMSGFGAALIQKKDRDEKDFSTTFYYNIVVALLFYALLFLSAPLIADFYNEPLLVNLTRVISLTFVIEAFAVVQRAKFTINVDFKSQSKATLTSVIVAGVIGIYMAYVGYGVWALVAQSLTRGFVNSVNLWIISKWVPKEGFSYMRFKSLFSFGSKLLMAGILHSIAQNISKLVIGKAFSTQALGYYTRANQFASFPSVNMLGILGRVTFPILCRLQEDKEQLLQKQRQILKIAAFLIFPMMIGLIVLAQPLILTVLTDKWADSIWMLRIISIGLVFLPINSLNVSILSAIGRSDLFFKADLVKQFLIIGLLIVSYPFGIRTVLWGQVFAMILSYFISLFIIKKHIGLGIMKQFFDFIPIIINCLLMAIAILLINNLFQSELYQLIFGSLVGAFVYLGIAWVFNIAEARILFFDILKIKQSQK